MCFCFFNFSARQGSFAPSPRGREAQTQVEASGSAPQLVLHGCQVPRMLQDHHRLFTRPDGRGLRRLFHRSLSTHRGKGQAHRR